MDKGKNQPQYIFTIAGLLFGLICIYFSSFSTISNKDAFSYHTISSAINSKETVYYNSINFYSNSLRISLLSPSDIYFYIPLVGIFIGILLLVRNYFNKPNITICSSWKTIYIITPSICLISAGNPLGIAILAITIFNFLALYFQFFKKKNLTLILAINILGVITTIHWYITSIILSYFLAMTLKKELDARFYFCLTVTLTVLIFLSFPLPSTLDIPNNSAVLPPFEIASFPLPYFIGHNTPRAYINKPEILKLYTIPVLSLLALSLGYIHPTFKKIKTAQGKLSLIAIILSALIVLDLCLPYKFSVNLPLESLGRIIPPLYLGSTALYLIPLTFFLWFIVTFNTKVVRKLLVLSSIATFGFVFYHQNIHRASIDKAITTIKKLPNGYINFKNPVGYPILYLAKSNYSENLISQSKLKGRSDYRPLEKDEVKITTSHNQKDALTLLDNSSSTRWSPQKGGQSGDEYVQLEFLEPTPIKKIEFSVGNFVTDFPDELSVIYGDSCANSRGKGTYQHTFAPWFGSLTLSDKNLLSFGKREVFEMTFPNEGQNPINCLKIMQTGRRNFDWSIATIRIIK